MFVFPSFGLEADSDRLGLKNFHELLKDVLPEKYKMTLVEAKRLLKYMDKGGTGSLSMDAMVGFMSSGLELNQSKRAKYTMKSDMHMKIMKFLEGMWACSSMQSAVSD